MRIKVPNYYKDFNCIGSKCTDTCCAGWEVVIDDQSYQFYKTVEGEFGKRLKSTMVSDDENSFILQNGNCPFLNESKLCDLYTELGEDKLCNTCKTYPRFIEEFGDLREVGISLSCPEAARLILEDAKPVTFELEKNSEMITTYNDIDPELFMQLISSRKIAIEILQNRSIKLNNRIALLVSFAKDIQEKIDKNKVSRIDEVKIKYTKVNFEEQYIASLMKYKEKGSLKYNNMFHYIDTYLKLENISDRWPEIINHTVECLHGVNCNSQSYAEQYAHFNDFYRDKMYEFEHLMVYFIFRYYMKAVYDQDIYSKVKLAVVSFLMIQEMDVTRWIDKEGNLDLTDQIDIMHLYSKEIEHSDYNLEKLAKLFKEDKMFDYEQLITMLMN